MTRDTLEGSTVGAGAVPSGPKVGVDATVLSGATRGARGIGGARQGDDVNGEAVLGGGPDGRGGGPCRAKARASNARRAALGSCLGSNLVFYTSATIWPILRTAL